MRLVGNGNAGEGRQSKVGSICKTGWFSANTFAANVLSALFDTTMKIDF